MAYVLSEALILGVSGVTGLSAWLVVRWHPHRVGVTVSVAMLIMLLTGRWAFITAPVELNVDESQFVAGALTLIRDPVFFKAVDTGTSGPLNIYALVPGMMMTWLPASLAARLTATLCIWVALLATWALARRWTDVRTATMVVLPAVALFALAPEPDFQHYSSELVPMALIAVATMMGCEGREGRRWYLWSAAFITGLLPWAKLQAGPIGLVLGCWFVGFGWRSGGPSRAARAQNAATVALAGLLPSLATCVTLAVTGLWPRFQQSYLAGNFDYTMEKTELARAVQEFVQTCKITMSFPAYLLTVSLMVSLGLITWLARRARPGWRAWLAASLVAGAVISVLGPRRGYEHYLVFLVTPLTLLTVCACGAWHQSLPRRGWWLRTVIIVTSLTLPLTARWCLGLRAEWFWLPPLTQGANVLATAIKPHARPGDTMTVWGWAPRVHGLTRLPQGINQAVSVSEIVPSPDRDAVRRPRYLRRIKIDQPALFVDATGPASLMLTLRGRDGVECFPELAAFLASNYRLVHDDEMGRIYLRNDLADQREKVAY